MVGGPSSVVRYLCNMKYPLYIRRDFAHKIKLHYFLRETNNRRGILRNFLIVTLKLDGGGGLMDCRGHAPDDPVFAGQVG